MYKNRNRMRQMARRPEEVDYRGEMFTSFTPKKGRIVVTPNNDYLRLDSSNSEKIMRPELKKILGDRPAEYVFDYRSVQYISGSALREMVEFVRNLHIVEKEKRIPDAARKDVTIVPSDRVLEVLQLAGLDSLFKIENDPNFK